MEGAGRHGHSGSSITFNAATYRFNWVELQSDNQARAIGLDSANDSGAPVCLFSDGTRMENPTVRQILEKLGWFRDPSSSEYDLAIYGGGPAG